MSNDPLLWYIMYKEVEKENNKRRAEKAARYASFNKEQVQATMRSNDVKKLDKIWLFCGISWKQRISWFPKITLIYVLITGIIGYFLGCMAVSWLGL